MFTGILSPRIFMRSVSKLTTEPLLLSFLMTGIMAKDFPFIRLIIFRKMKKPAFVFDGRNILDHRKLFDMGFNVYSVGRPALTHFKVD